MDQTPQAQEYLRCCARNLDRLRRENGDRAQPPSVQHGTVYASEVASILKRTDEQMLEYMRTYRLPESFADGTPCSPFMGYKKYLNRKLYWSKPHRNSHGNIDRPVHWGNRFEPIAARIFHSMEGKTVEMFPKKIHRRYRWLGAIADGVVYDFPSRPEVELLEMKCPFRAGISEIPPPYYWLQAQILMEVFDIGVTNFFQCQFRTYRNEEEFLADEIKVGQDKGVCIQFGLDDVTPSPEDATLTEAIEWAKDVIDAQYPDERLKEVYWKLEDASIIRIKRDSQWFEKIKHILYRAHLDIQGYPANYVYDPELPAMPIFQSTEPEQLTKYIETSEDICGESNDEGVV